MTIEQQNIGQRPDVPGGIDPTPIRVAIEQIDFSNWENADATAGR